MTSLMRHRSMAALPNGECVLRCWRSRFGGLGCVPQLGKLCPGRLWQPGLFHVVGCFCFL